ncbi:helix-turn-helix transcriptional regulator [Phenylobacterium sp.]|uniref:helix-turn-helix transcriptional regulator n=1 Tax=Phenylobacterium sp. TaxID=1871053 RepID=UPI0039565092
MSDVNSVLPPRLLRTDEAARWLGLSGRTLEKHRCTGKGPSFRKLGGRVVYTIADLQAWIDEGERRVTTPRVPPSRHGPLRSERRSFAHR